MKVFTRVLLSFVLMVSLSGCSNFRHLKNDLDVIEQDFDRYSIDVSYSSAVAKQPISPLVLVSLSDASTEGIGAYRLLGNAGKINISDSSKIEAFFVFKDLNEDLIFQSNEPFDWVSVERAADSGGILVRMTIRTLQEHSLQPPSYLVGQNFHSFRDVRGIDINTGTVTPLDDPNFSLAQAKKGMWQPLQFMLDGGAGLHQLQPYDTSKIPVLFVHGLSGSPVNFTHMIAALDQTRYQAFVFSYPSGYRVETMANGLYYLTNALQKKLKFDQMHVISHSLGGLVSRAYFNQCQREQACQYLRSYTSLSAPWGGSSGAKLGADTAPVVMPVWKDLSPDSELLASLFSTPLPNQLPHLLMFSFRNDSRLNGGSGDGVVALESQLRAEAQEQAKLLRGYNESHTGILANPDVALEWKKFMNRY